MPYRTSSLQTASTGGATSLAVNVPVGHVAGDIIIVGVSSGGNGSTPQTISLTGGPWNTLASDGTTKGTCTIFWKVDSGSEPSTYTASWTTSDATVIQAVAFSGLSATQANTPSVAAVNGGSATITASSVTCALNDDLILFFPTHNAGSSPAVTTPPSGPWSQIAYTTSGGSTGMALYYQNSVSAGASSPAASLTWNNSTLWYGATLWNMSAVSVTPSYPISSDNYF